MWLRRASEGKECSIKEARVDSALAPDYNLSGRWGRSVRMPAWGKPPRDPSGGSTPAPSIRSAQGGGSYPARYCTQPTSAAVATSEALDFGFKDGR